MEPGVGLPRNASVEELALSMFGAGAANFRLGRTPSEAEFSQFLSANGLVAPPGEGGDVQGAGMHRVASIDLLRRMVLSQQAAISQAAAGAAAGDVASDPAHALAAAGLSGVALPGAPLLGPTPVPVVLPPVLPDWGKVLRGAATDSVLPLVSGTLPVLPPQPGGHGGSGGGHGGGRRAKAAAPPKKESARARAAREKREAAAAEKAARGEATPEDDFTHGDSGGEDDDFDEEELRKAMAKGNMTAEEVRRQRRMLSNRESARRSRRRKLEHVHTLQAQINVLRAEATGLLERLRDAELRSEAALRENVALKVELERMASLLRETMAAAGANGAGPSLPAAGGGLLTKSLDRVGSLPRIASTDHIAKRLRESDDAVGGTESPRGFVPFRSLRSYENLLALQAQAASGAAITPAA